MEGEGDGEGLTETEGDGVGDEAPEGIEPDPHPTSEIVAKVSKETADMGKTVRHRIRVAERGACGFKRNLLEQRAVRVAGRLL
jgi:hypothetical protein